MDTCPAQLLPPYPAATIYRPDGGTLLHLSAEPATQLLVGRWHGYATPELVQRGALGALAYARQYAHFRTALSDSSHIVGDWLDLLPWLRYDFLPDLMAAGIQALAFVPSFDASTRLGLATFAESAAPLLPTQLFDLEPEARQWLSNE